mgnify:CR=1 FL=1
MQLIHEVSGQPDIKLVIITGLSGSGKSVALKVLEEADLVIAVRRGRERWNHLNALPIRDIHERWIGAYAAFAVDKLAALKRELEA